MEKSPGPPEPKASKSKWWFAVAVMLLVGSGYLLYQQFRFVPDTWKIELKSIATTSSPQAIDLNADGIDDLVLGAGAAEFEWTDNGVLAIDGKTGGILWKAGARNQVVGSPSFKDINGDGIQDVFIGGRSAILYCLDGKSGKLIWEYLPDGDSLNIYSDTTILNFFNSQFIPDVSGDRVDDLLTAYGGYVAARPNETDRPVGYLMVIDAVTGKEIVRAAVPDGKETYMSPVVHDFDGDGMMEVIFGTGGETIDGHLYKAPLASVIKGDLSDAIELNTGRGKGFVAPVVLADVNGDGVPDVIANAVKGRTVCIDGARNKVLWEFAMGDKYEVYISHGPGNFNGDEVPDFFTSFGKGVWPNIDSSVNVALDGRNGNVLFKDTLGTFQYGSPVVIEITGDGIDDVIFVTNVKSRQQLAQGFIPFLENRLMVYDILAGKKQLLDHFRLGTNLGSTPLLADLDHDGHLDIIHCYGTDATNSYSFSGLAMERIELLVSPQGIRWRSYMDGDPYASRYPMRLERK